MSRVADALWRVAGRGADDAALRGDSNPWGGDLRERTPPPAPLVVSTRERIHPVRLSPITAPPEQAPRPTVEAVHPARDDRGTQQLRAMIDRLFLPVAGTPIRSVAFAGIGVGSSAVTASTAELLAGERGLPVCVVDTNLDAPALHGEFADPNESGLADALTAGTPLAGAAREVQPNLWLLPAGRRQPQARPGVDAVSAALAELTAAFEHVLVDIGPLSATADAGRLAALLDGLILVVEADRTRRESARWLTQRLQAGGASVLGVVLTNRRYPIPDRLYRLL
jgi:Mrp family chromosome partitioning ATPase